VNGHHLHTSQPCCGFWTSQDCRCRLSEAHSHPWRRALSTLQLQTDVQRGCSASQSWSQALKASPLLLMGAMLQRLLLGLTRLLCSFYRQWGNSGKNHCDSGAAASAEPRIIATVMLLYLQSLLKYMVPEAVHIMEAGIIIYARWPRCSRRLQKDSCKG